MSSSCTYPQDSSSLRFNKITILEKKKKTAGKNKQICSQTFPNECDVFNFQ